MKKWFFILISLLVFSGLAWADHGTFGTEVNGKSVEGRVFVSKELTGGADGNVSWTMTASDLKYVKGRYAQEIISTPGTEDEEPSAYTITISDALGRTLTTTARSTTATESYPIPSNLGANWAVISAITITVTGIGEGNTANVVLLIH